MSDSVVSLALVILQGTEVLAFLGVAWWLATRKDWRVVAPAPPKRTPDSAALAAEKPPAGAAVQNIDRQAASR